MATSLIPVWLLDKELRGRPESEQEDLERYCEQATAIALDWMEKEANIVISPAVWDQETLPKHIQAGILRIAVHLYAHRGDEDDIKGPLTDSAKSLLLRERPPTIA